MGFEPDISRLENVVSNLLEEYNVVKNKYEQLTIDLAESIAEVEALKEEKITMLNEKGTVHSRVASILEKLSDWEEGLASKDKDGSGKGDVSKDAGGQLFSMGTSS